MARAVLVEVGRAIFLSGPFNSDGHTQLGWVYKKDEFSYLFLANVVSQLLACFVIFSFSFSCHKSLEKFHEEKSQSSHPR
jgi:hypothetical protein